MNEICEPSGQDETNKTIERRNKIIHKYLIFRFTVFMGMILILIVLTQIFPSFKWYIAAILSIVSAIFFGYQYMGLIILKKANENMTINKSIFYGCWLAYRNIDFYFDPDKRYEVNKIFKLYIYSFLAMFIPVLIIFLIWSALSNL